MAYVNGALELLAFVSLIVSAALWFISASVKLTHVGAGLDALDDVTILSGDIQKMARWNFWAALSTGCAVALQTLIRYAF